MSAFTEPNASQSLQALRKAVENGEVQLTIEPRLFGKPRQRLEWFERLSARQAVACGSKDVEYYFRSATPLMEYQKRGIFAQGNYCITNANGQATYYYRMSGKYMGTAENGSKTPSFDLDGLPFSKFKAGQDPFFVTTDNEKSKFGVGIAKTGKDYTLVVRSGQNPLKLLEDSGLLLGKAELAYTHDAALSWTAPLGPLPPLLARSIQIAHGLPEPAAFKDTGDLLRVCRRNATLFSPVAPVAEKPAAALPGPAVTEAPPATPAESLLQEAAKACDARITARRRGDGSVQYWLTMNRDAADAAPLDAAWKKRFPKPYDVASWLSKEIGFSAPRQQTAVVQNFRIEPDSLRQPSSDACVREICAHSGITFDAASVSPFEIRTKRSGRMQNEFNLSETGKVALWLLEENGNTFVVAVADKAKVEQGKLAKLVRDRLGMRPAEGVIKSSALLTEEEKTSGKTTSAIYSKIPIAPAAYADLLADAIPALQRGLPFIEQIRSTSQIPAQTLPSAATITLANPHTTQPTKITQANSSLRQMEASRDERLVGLLGQLHSDTGEFYISRVRSGDEVRPSGYIITTPRQLKSLRDRLDHLNEEYKATGSSSGLHEVGRSGEGKTARVVVAIPLNEECFSILQRNDLAKRTADKGYESFFLSLALHLSDRNNADHPVERDAAITLLTQRAAEIVAEAIPQAAQQAGNIRLTGLLEPLARHTKGGMATVEFPAASRLNTTITGLENDLTALAPWARASGTPPVGGRAVETRANETQAMLADPSRLASTPRTLSQIAASGRQVAEDMKAEIARLKRTLAFVELYGTQLPVLVVRGLPARIKTDSLKGLLEALDRPENTSEGHTDRTEGRMNDGAYGIAALRPDSSAVLRVHDIGLNSGAKKERKASILVITPALAARIQAELEQHGRSANRIGEATAIPDNEINDAVSRHYVPATPPKVRPPKLGEMFEALGHRAILVRQRTNGTAGGLKVAPAHAGAQEAFYLAVDTSNYSAASTLLLALYQHDAFAGEKHYSAIAQTRPENPEIEAKRAYLATVKSIIRDCRAHYDSLFDASYFGHAHQVLAALRSTGNAVIPLSDRQSIRFQSGRTGAVLSNPQDTLWGTGLSAEEQSAFQSIVLKPVAAALQAAGKEKILSLLGDVRDGKAIAADDVRVDAYATLLGKLPENMTRLCESHISDLAGLEDVPLHEPKKMAEATFSSPSLTFTGINGSRTIMLGDDPALARKAVKDALAEACREPSPVIVHGILNSDIMAQIDAGKIRSTRFFSLARNSVAEGESVPFLISRAARRLDSIATGQSAHTQEEILGALKGFYGIGDGQASGRGR